MNVLSKLLDIAADHGVFSFHPKCKKVRLTHLCFADDLLIFSKGKLDSIIGIQRVMELFYTYSGLQLNSSKCELFSAGVNGARLLEIQQATGFKLGTLPVRYLGVRLVTRRFIDKDCSPLVDRIIAMINHWSVKFLSYTGRFQLIQTVLYSVYNYWCRHFLLSQSVLKRVNKLCSQFFWKGNSGSAKGARVSWKFICHSKAEGGLGFKDTLSWNQACNIQHIWEMFTKAGSLWIAWIETYVLKGRSIWNISATQSSSWNWRKLLKLRPLARNLLK